MSEEWWGAEVTWLSPWAVCSLQSGRRWESCMLGTVWCLGTRPAAESRQPPCTAPLRTDDPAAHSTVPDLMDFSMGVPTLTWA